MRLIFGVFLALSVWSCDSAKNLAGQISDSNTSGQDSVDSPFSGLSAEKWIHEKYEKYDLYCKLKNFETTSGHYFIEKELPVIELLKNPEKGLFIDLQGDYSQTKIEIKVARARLIERAHVQGADRRTYEIKNAPALDLIWSYQNTRQIDPGGELESSEDTGTVTMYENVPFTLFAKDTGIDTPFGLFIGADCKINAVVKPAAAPEGAKTQSE